MNQLIFVAVAAATTYYALRGLEVPALRRRLAKARAEAAELRAELSLTHRLARNMHLPEPEPHEMPSARFRGWDV